MKGARAFARALLLLAILAGIYVGVYTVLSLNGSYVSSQTGQVRVAGGGLLVNDVSVWRPRGVRLKISLDAGGHVKREANILGWLFYPLERLDRQYWHRSQHPFLDLLNGWQAPPPAKP